MTQDSTTSEEKSSRSYWGFVLWPVAVIVLYVLSAGPVAFAVGKRFIDWRCLRIYRPVAEAFEGTGFERPFGMYLNMWSRDWYRNDGILFIIF